MHERCDQQYRFCSLLRDARRSHCRGILLSLFGTNPMPDPRPLTFLCITTYEKGQEFMRECKRQGCRIFLLTVESLRNADWPRESLDDVFYIPADLPLPEIVKAVTYLAREKKIDRIVALDEYDME